MLFRDTVQEYRRSGARRLEDARELLEPPTFDPQRSDAERRHLRGAMYLAGYAVECLLKAYLIQLNEAQTLKAAVETINQRRMHQGLAGIENIARSAAGHKIEYLLQLTDLPQFPDFDRELWGRLAQWSSSWRYETDAVPRARAAEFLDDVQASVNWLTPKVSGG